MISVALWARALVALVSANKSAPPRDQLAHNFLKGADLIERTVMAVWKANAGEGSFVELVPRRQKAMAAPT